MIDLLEIITISFERGIGGGGFKSVKSVKTMSVKKDYSYIYSLRETYKKSVTKMTYLTDFQNPLIFPRGIDIILNRSNI